MGSLAKKIVDKSLNLIAIRNNEGEYPNVYPLLVNNPALTRKIFESEQLFATLDPNTIEKLILKHLKTDDDFKNFINQVNEHQKPKHPMISFRFQYC